MEEKYYSAEDFEELAAEVFSAEEAIKYLLNIPQDNPDTKLRTPELMEEMEHLANNCEALLRAYNYYIKAENFKCANAEEMANKAMKA